MGMTERNAGTAQGGRAQAGSRAQTAGIDEELIHHLKLKLPELLPARMLNEFVYCPRLFFYEWVEGVFESSTDTIDGQAKHVRVDSGPEPMPEAGEIAGEGGEERIHSRSVTLSSARCRSAISRREAGSMASPAA